jgi:hypothetical protein
MTSSQNDFSQQGEALVDPLEPCQCVIYIAGTLFAAASGHGAQLWISSLKLIWKGGVKHTRIFEAWHSTMLDMPAGMLASSQLHDAPDPFASQEDTLEADSVSDGDRPLSWSDFINCSDSKVSNNDSVSDGSLLLSGNDCANCSDSKVTNNDSIGVVLGPHSWTRCVGDCDDYYVSREDWDETHRSAMIVALGANVWVTDMTFAAAGAVLFGLFAYRSRVYIQGVPPCLSARSADSL